MLDFSPSPTSQQSDAPDPSTGTHEGVPADSGWHVVRCKANEDRRAVEHLGNQGFEAFSPSCRVARRVAGARRTVIEPLFPGYAFVQLSTTRHDWGLIRSTRGVLGLVRFGLTTPRVPEAVVAMMRTLDGMTLEPPGRRLKPGDPVRVLDGPLRGLQGVFEQRDGAMRAYVLLEYMNRSVRVTVPDALLAPAG